MGKVEICCKNYYKTERAEEEEMKKFGNIYTRKMVELINQIEKGKGQILKKDNVQ